jgi:hypothetical protein
METTFGNYLQQQTLPCLCCGNSQCKEMSCKVRRPLFDVACPLLQPFFSGGTRFPCCIFKRICKYSADEMRTVLAHIQQQQQVSKEVGLEFTEFVRWNELTREIYIYNSEIITYTHSHTKTSIYKCT